MGIGCGVCAGCDPIGAGVYARAWEAEPAVGLIVLGCEGAPLSWIVAEPA